MAITDRKTDKKITDSKVRGEKDFRGKIRAGVHVMGSVVDLAGKSIILRSTTRQRGENLTAKVAADR
jgi:hypothetical protein